MDSFALRKRRTIPFLKLCLFLTAAPFPANLLPAADWPQLLGPDRNGIAQNEQLQPWPAAGPRLVWDAPLGAGYAGPIVSANRTLVFHRQDDQDLLEAWHATTGKKIWSQSFPATYRGGIDRDQGPRATPLVHAGIVFAYSAAGDLHAVSLDDGAKLWSRALYLDYRGDEGYFGAGSSPIAIHDRLLLNVGGKGAGIVALDPKTGKTLWQATDEAASYASPSAIECDGKACAVFATRLNLVVVDVASGAVKVRFPFGMRGPTVNAATPLVSGKQLFLTASYGIGASLVELEPSGHKSLWNNDQSLSSQYNTPVECDGELYGIHGREDQGVAELRCIQRASGKILWTESDFGVAHLIRAGKAILALKASGDLVLFSANPQAYTPLAKAKVALGNSRSLPALANGRLYLKEISPTKARLLCYSVGATPPSEEK